MVPRSGICFALGWDRDNAEWCWPARLSSLVEKVKFSRGAAKTRVPDGSSYSSQGAEMNFQAGNEGFPSRFSQIAGARQRAPAPSPHPTRPPLPTWPGEAHLEADTHVGRHDDLVAFAVHLGAPQELALGGRDVVLAAVVAQLDALLPDQKHALGHVLVRRLRGVAKESLRDFLGGQSTHRMGDRKGGAVRAPEGTSKGHSGALLGSGVIWGFMWSSPS